MSQSISIATALERSRLDSDVPLLVALEIEVVNPQTSTVVETLRFVRNDEELTIAGQLYTNVIFDITFGAEAGSLPSIDLSIREITGAMQTRMEEYSGCVGFGVKMMIVDAGRLNDEPELTEFFQILSASTKDYDVSFRLGGESEVSKTFPRRSQTRDFCQWTYKDPETCGYPKDGPFQSCDLTLQGANGCAKHKNTLRFGGFPGITSNGVRYG